jgi:hypothetical protein
MKAVIRGELNHMIRDFNVEVSRILHVNSLVIISQDEKLPRIYLDARKVTERPTGNYYVGSMGLNS